MRREMTWTLRVVLALSVVFWSVPATFAAGTKPVKARTRATALFAGKVTGTIIDADGKTPARGVAVKVYDAKGKKLLVNTVSDRNGKYTLAKLTPGNYRLVVADRVMTDVTVMTDGEIVELDFRVPHIYLAPEDEKTAGTPKTTKPKTKLVRFALVTVGAGAAIALPLTIHHGDDDDDAPASPVV